MALSCLALAGVALSINTVPTDTIRIRVTAGVRTHVQRLTTAYCTSVCASSYDLVATTPSPKPCFLHPHTNLITVHASPAFPLGHMMCTLTRVTHVATRALCHSHALIYPNAAIIITSGGSQRLHIMFICVHISAYVTC